jgi:hypothetical protein
MVQDIEKVKILVASDETLSLRHLCQEQRLRCGNAVFT